MRKELEHIRNEINKENVSYSEILYLQNHQDEVKELGDIVLAQWAGIKEEEWNED